MRLRRDIVFPFVERLVSLAILCFSTEIFAPREVLHDPTESNHTLLVVQIILYGAGGLLCVSHLRLVLAGVVRARYVLALVALAALSTLWSHDPALTLRRSVVLFCAILWAIYFGSRFSLREQVQLVAGLMMVLLALNIGAAVLFPSYGLDQGAWSGDWRGLLQQKNALARLTVVSFILFLYWKPRLAVVRNIALLLAAATLMATRSATGAVVLALIVLIRTAMWLADQPKRPRTFLAGAAATAMLALFTIPFLSDANALNVIGRDTTLTGRTVLWRIVFDEIGQHPFLGYGWMSFWEGQVGPSRHVLSAAGWSVPNAHNGFLDLWLDLGVAGVGLLLLAYFSVLKGAFRLYQRDREMGGWALLFLVFLFSYNLTESTFKLSNSTFMLLFTALSVRLTAVFLPARSRHYAEALHGHCPDLS